MAVDRVETILKAVGYEVGMGGGVPKAMSGGGNCQEVVRLAVDVFRPFVTGSPAQRTAGLGPGIGTRKNTAEAV